MKCSMKYFFQIAFCLSMFLTLNSQAAATDGPTIFDLLGNDVMRKRLAEAMKGFSAAGGTRTTFGSADMDDGLLKTILPPVEASRYAFSVGPSIRLQGTVINYATDGTPTIFISFDSLTDGETYKKLDPGGIWCPFEGTSRTTRAKLLTDFFDAITENRTQIQLDRFSVVLALYLQHSIWKIIDPITTAKSNYSFVVTGHGAGAGVAEIFAPMLFQRLQQMKTTGTVNVVAIGPPRVLKYAAARHMGITLGGRDHIAIFATQAKSGAVDPLPFYPETCFVGSKKAVDPFLWAIADDAQRLAQDNNIWTHPVEVTRLMVEVGLDTLLRGTKLEHLVTYASALKDYHPTTPSSMELKAMSHVYDGGGGGASASAPSPATVAILTAAAAAAPTPAPGAISAPTLPKAAPAAVPATAGAGKDPIAPPVPPVADGGAGTGSGGSALGYLSDWWRASASPGKAETWGDYLPSSLAPEFLAGAVDSVKSGLTAGKGLLAAASEAAARAGGKVLFGRDLADKTLTFENYCSIFQNALAHNEDAFKILNGLADKSPIAKGYVAILLAFGGGTAVNLPLARKYAAEVAADIEGPAFYDVADALILYGLMLETGLGTTAKYPTLVARRTKAKEYYTKALAAKPSEAYYRLGELARAEGNRRDAIELLTKASGMYNNPYALNALGELYYEVGDFEGAKKRFELAAEVQGNSAAAKYGLGRLYYEQEMSDLSSDRRKAIAKEYLGRAAALGNTGAHRFLGYSLYEEGDYKGAFDHFTAATMAALAPTPLDLTSVFKSREKDAAEAHFYLYLMHSTGHTRENKPNPTLAITHLTHAATLGHTRANILLSEHVSGHIFDQQAEALYHIGNMYYTGTFAPLDSKAALTFFSNPKARISAETQFAAAVVELEMLGAQLSTPTPAAGGAGTGFGGVAKPVATPAATATAALLSALATPPSGSAGAGKGLKAESSIPEPIQGFLAYAKSKGSAEAARLLSRLQTEGVEKVAKSIYTRRNPRPGVKARISIVDAIG